MVGLNLAHSFNPKPAFAKRWGEDNQLVKNIWYYAVSVACAKRIGARIELYTDKLGADLLDFLPYDKIHTVLEQMNIDKRLWAAGKFWAYPYMSAGTIHIDADVLLKSRQLIKLLQFNDYSAMFQNFENIFHGGAGCYRWNLDNIKPTLPAWFNDTLKPYNCGLVGFNDMALKRNYVETYFDCVDKIMSDKTLLFHTANEQDVCPDLVLEQWLLPSLFQKENAHAKFLFDGDRNFWGEAGEIGYAHVIGKWKYSDEAINETKKYLKALDINLYNHIIKHYDNENQHKGTRH